MAETSIPNPTAPTFEIQLDRKRKILFDWNSAAAVETITKKNMLVKENWNAIFRNMNVTNVRLLLWAGLVWEDPNLTIGDVGRLISRIAQDTLPTVIEQLNHAITAHLLQAEEKDDRPLAEGTKVPVKTAA